MALLRDRPHALHMIRMLMGYEHGLDVFRSGADFMESFHYTAAGQARVKYYGMPFRAYYI